MAYCRFGDNSDLYIYGDLKSLVCFNCCLLNMEKHFSTEKYSDMIIHLKDHINNKDKFPKGVIELLEWEQKQFGNIYNKHIRKFMK